MKRWKLILIIIACIFVIGCLIGSAYWSSSHHNPHKSENRFVQIADQCHLQVTQSISHEDNIIGVLNSYLAMNQKNLHIEYYEMDSQAHTQSMQSTWNQQYRLMKPQLQSQSVKLWHNSRVSPIHEFALIAPQSLFFYATHNNKVLYATGSPSDLNLLRRISRYALKN